MFKTSEEIIVIQAEATTPIPTGVVFWSHDKGTAKLIIQLKKGHINQTLSQGTIVPILLEFNSDTAAKGKGRHIYHAVIEDALEGIVSIVLEENILGYQGRVDGSIYIELPDSRSLDTAGRFTFDIKRSPIDEDVPELEDYYWQGFNEIIDEYHQTINTIKSEAKALIDSLTADVTEVKNDIATANVKIAEIRKKLDDNDVFTKAESSANVIYQLVGKEKVQLTFSTDFTNKVTGSLAENRNIAKVYAASTLGIPGKNGSEVGRYDQLASLDNNTYRNATKIAGNSIQLESQLDVINIVTEGLSELFWESLGLKTTLEKVNFLKENFAEIIASSYGYGSSPSGNKLTMYRAANDSIGEHSSWINCGNHANSTVTRVDAVLRNKSQFETALNKDGYFSIATVAEASDGVGYSVINIDYLKLDFTIELSMNQFLKSMMAANHVENLATQDEAETGEDNTKTMTPLRVFQSIAQWTKNKFISLTENETVLGIKNFANGLQVGGNNVLSQKGEIVFDHTSDTDSSIQSGIVRFKRYGDWVLVNFNFQCRSTNIASGGNLIGSLEADIVPSGSIQVDVTYDKALTIDASGKVTALWGLEANNYYAGSATYLAKNKL
ncbi:BppU family phage baseplate upper protein [Enterococcus avium]|uniref:BppU family phage baseplate upper protein n=1 Tax=Enterococcus avium TaxID=33945 RepID=UPI0022E9174B|nr:BppU family phage baseplate upper protein [Enterococcus avium]